MTALSTRGAARVVKLESNRPPRFYRGGQKIDDFRGDEARGEWDRPEDWIASTTSLFGEVRSGQTAFDGRLLLDWIAAEPEPWLGSDHVNSFGADPALLVKLLAPEQRLPIHAHPDRAFTRRHLGGRWGKTEAWIVLETGGSGGDVFLGWKSPISRDDLSRAVEDQATEDLLQLMHRVTVQPRDAVFVPAGTAHAVGAEVLVLELQEPSDLSVLLEWRGFDIDGPRLGRLGLDQDVALLAVDVGETSAARLDELVRRADALTGRSSLPAEAEQFFRLEMLSGTDQTPQPAGYAVVVVTGGHGLLEPTFGSAVPVSRGSTLVVPFAAGPWRLRGVIAGLCCRPPDPLSPAIQFEGLARTTGGNG